MAACRDDLEPWALDDLESLCAPPRASSWLEKAKAIPDGAWIAGDHEFFTGKILPSPSGHPSSVHIKPVGRLQDGPERQLLRSSKQLPTLRKTSWQEGDDALLRAQEGKVRRIQPIEVWRPKGGSTPAWRSALAEGHTPPTSWQLGRLGPHPREPPRWARPGVTRRSVTFHLLTKANVVLAYARSQTRKKRGWP